MTLSKNLGGTGVGQGSNTGPMRAGRAGRLGSIGAKSGTFGASQGVKKSDPFVVKADQRLAKIKEDMQSKKTAATSAAHVGVVARPMDKNLSKMLEQRRAQFQGPGTSVARLGKENATGASSTTMNGDIGQTPSETEMPTSVARLGKIESLDPALRSTSVARLGRPGELPSYLPPPPPLPPSSGKKIPTDLYGDL